MTHQQITSKDSTNMKFDGSQCAILFASFAIRTMQTVLAKQLVQPSLATYCISTEMIKSLKRRKFSDI